MDTTKTNLDVLNNYILKTANRVAKAESFNVVQTGTIKTSKIGGYIVQLANGGAESNVNAVSLNANDTFKEGDYVYLLAAPVANGDLHQTKYFIFGLVSDTKEDFLNASEFERFAGVNEKTSVVSNHNFLNNEQNYLVANIENEILLSDIRELGIFAITGVFTCLNQESITDYGLEIKFLKDDDLVKTIIYNTSYFVGQPFNMDAGEQAKIFILNEDIDFNKISIYSFYKGTANNSGQLFLTDGTIQAGSLVDLGGSLKIKVIAVDGKNYFIKSTDRQSIEFKAIVTYDGQELSAESMQFYWVTDKESFSGASADPERDLHFVEDGWYCINPYSTSSVLNGESIPVWDRQKNTLKLTRKFDGNGKEQILVNDNFNAMDYISNFVTQLKCVVKYQGVVVTSDEIEIINYSKEDFELTIKSGVDNNTLIYPADIIMLNSEIKSKNKYISLDDYEYQYLWYIKIGNLEIGLTDENGVSFTKKYIAIKDNDKNSDAEKQLYEMNNPSEVFICKVTILNKNNDLVSVETSNPITIRSITGNEVQVKTFYKYYISTNRNVIFEKKSETGSETSWQGDWVIKDGQEDNKTWSSEEGTEDLNTLKSLGLKDGEYLYYTQQTRWYEQNSKIKASDWENPSIYRYKTENGTEADASYINQLNNYRELSDSGRKQGAFLEYWYTETKDTSPVGNKKYYIKKSGMYEEVKISENKFLDGVKYFERSDRELLTINAEYINTGALTVSKNILDENDQVIDTKTILDANVGEGTVEIAGFTVTDSNIVSKSNEVNKYVRVSSDPDLGAFVAGPVDNQATDENKEKSRPFYVSHEGELRAANATITGDITAKSLTISQAAASEAGLYSENLLEGITTTELQATRPFSNFSNKDYTNYVWRVPTKLDLSPIFDKYFISSGSDGKTDGSNTYYTLSFDLKIKKISNNEIDPNANKIRVQIAPQSLPGIWQEYAFSSKVSVDTPNEWKRYKVSFTIKKANFYNGDGITEATISQLEFERKSNHLYDYGFFVKNIKLELANLSESDFIPSWTPSKEDSIIATNTATEFEVNTTENYIKLQTKDLIINSDELKLNCDSKGNFKKGELIISTTSLKLNCDSKGNNYSKGNFIINTEHFKFNTKGNNHLLIDGNATIGGFHITNTHLGDKEDTGGVTDGHLVMLSSGLEKPDPEDKNKNVYYVFWAGAQEEAGNDETRPFWIRNDGSMHATSGTIGGYEISDTILQTKSQLTGIGSWEEDIDSLKNPQYSFWAGKIIDPETDKFKEPRFSVSPSGILTATTIIFDNLKIRDGSMTISKISLDKEKEEGIVMMTIPEIKANKIYTNENLFVDQIFSIFDEENPILSLNQSTDGTGKEYNYGIKHTGGNWLEVYEINGKEAPKGGFTIDIWYFWTFDSVGTRTSVSIAEGKTSSSIFAGYGMLWSYYIVNNEKLDSTIKITIGNKNPTTILNQDLCPKKSSIISLGRKSDDGSYSWDDIYTKHINGIPWSTIVEKLGITTT